MKVMVLLIAVLCISGVYSLGFTVKDLSEGLVLHLNFEEGTGNVTHDLSGNNAEMHGSPRWAVGKIGLGMEFDGKDDYLELPKNASGFNISKGSVAFWIYPGESNATHYGVMHFRKVPTSDFIIFRYDNKNKRFQVIAEVNNTATLSVSTPSGSVPPKKWSHITIVQDGTAMKMYVNGVEQVLSGKNSGDWFSAHYPAKNDFSIGHAGSWKYYLNGVLDEVRVYDRALTAEEATSLMEARPKAVVGRDAGGNQILIFALVFIFVIGITIAELRWKKNAIKKA